MKLLLIVFAIGLSGGLGFMVSGSKPTGWPDFQIGAQQQNVDAEMPTITVGPTVLPTATPTANPSATPTPMPSETPTPLPTKEATITPTMKPTEIPMPTDTPTPEGSANADIYGITNKYADEYHVNADQLRHIAECESGFNAEAENRDYAGLYQFAAQTWQTYRQLMRLDTNPDLRKNAEEAIKTAAYIMSIGKSDMWPNCH